MLNRKKPVGDISLVPLRKSHGQTRLELQANNDHRHGPKSVSEQV